MHWETPAWTCLLVKSVGPAPVLGPPTQSHGLRPPWPALATLALLSLPDLETNTDTPQPHIQLCRSLVRDCSEPVRELDARGGGDMEEVDVPPIRGELTVWGGEEGPARACTQCGGRGTAEENIAS